jgi:hypothetical protein
LLTNHIAKICCSREQIRLVENGLNKLTDRLQFPKNMQPWFFKVPQRIEDIFL